MKDTEKKLPPIEETLKKTESTQKDLDKWAQEVKGYGSYAEWYNDQE